MMHTWCSALLCHVTSPACCLDQSRHIVSGFSSGNPALTGRTLLGVRLFALVEIAKLVAEVGFAGQYKKGRERQTVHGKHGGRTRKGASAGGNTDHVRLG